MEPRKLALLALEFDAKKNPDERVIIGYEVYTKAEVYERISNGDRRFRKLFLEPLIKLLKENEELRKATLAKLGLK